MDHVFCLLFFSERAMPGPLAPKLMAGYPFILGYALTNSQMLPP